MRIQVSALCALGALLWAPAIAAQTAPPAAADKPAPAAPPAAAPAAPAPAPKAAPAPAKPAPAPAKPDAGPPPIKILPPGTPPAPTPLPPNHPPVGPSAKRGTPPVPLAPPVLFPSQLDGDDDVEIVGIHDGRLFIRDPHDRFRLYPGGQLALDAYGAPGSPDLGLAQGGDQLNAHLALRRVRLELSGEILSRLSFTFGAELGTRRIGTTSFNGSGTPRFAPSNATDGHIRPAEVSISYAFRKWLNITIGQFNTPFSMENRTRVAYRPLLERNIAIRGLAVPHERELGATIWGELDERKLAWEVGVFSGDGPERPAADGKADFIGRVYARPLTTLGKGTFFKQAQIGVSARFGERDQNLVVDDYPTIATAQGFVAWQPGYTDSLDRLTHIVPSGAQRAIGGELRLPFDLPGGRGIDIRGEAYYVSNNTREAVDGFVDTNTERFGRFNGLGWYAQVSFWACCQPFVTGEPGVFRPHTVDLNKPDQTRRGIEILALAAGIHADYQGASREGSVSDPNTPNGDITLYQLGGALQYWYGRNVRMAINYFAYLAPDSGDPASNQAIVPDNLALDPETGLLGGGHVHHELGGRVGVSF